MEEEYGFWFQEIFRSKTILVRVSNRENGLCFFNQCFNRVSNVEKEKSQREGEKIIVATFPRISKTRWSLGARGEGGKREGEKAEVSSSTDSRATKEKAPASSRFAPVFFLGALPTGRAQRHHAVAKCPLACTRLRPRIFSFPPLLLLAGRSARKKATVIIDWPPSCPFLPSFRRE